MGSQLWYLILDAIKMDTRPRDSPVVALTEEVRCPFSDLNSVLIKHFLCAKPEVGISTYLNVSVSLSLGGIIAPYCG